ncbi:MAG: hypothetical protein ACP5GZ_00605 [Vulcanisaeta sp.]|uniref:Uncharacterized protein n=1 Tax=Vulcanisaeta moutnovskia (strain 768-28) TaxID=985053 RepID=F0QTC4_VULM7|nr:hypothetical protein [Vulcanisaeta moutnovskia]ADY00466.1 hypothetical protein VMUT_0252 [Vulcanisaeta moutnovskia 768-28]
MVSIDGRYLVLGFLDSVLTTLVLGETTRSTVKLVVIVTVINLVTAFMAEYIEERSSLNRIERSLLMRRGSLLRTSLHRKAIYDALIKGLIFGTVSLIGALITDLTMYLIKVLWIPVIPVIMLGVFGTLMSRYFRGNAILWLILYIVLGITMSFIGSVI